MAWTWIKQRKLTAILLAGAAIALGSYSWLEPQSLATPQPAAGKVASGDWYFDQQEPSRGEVKSITSKDGFETCAFRRYPSNLTVIYVAWSPKLSNSPAIILTLNITYGSRAAAVSNA